uniref:CUB domain-containing protein n=1 Tax=Sipha flava TaxID=143950 RepID=A0A2S2R4F3_9HEMI
MVFQFYVLMLGLFLLVTKTFTSLILPKVCSQSTDALDTVFESTGLIEPGECIFELTLKPKTCGVRIGFDKFLFNQPVKKDSTSAYVCAADLDLLELSGLGLPNIDLSVLCGDLSGHHIYLPTKDYDELLPLIDVKKLILKVIHVLVPDAPTPLWKIRLTQLPCPGEIEQDKKSIFSLPPMGCLQFHEKPEGIIESLNFANGKGHYMAEMNYAICIKRQPDTCGINQETTPSCF